MNRKVNTPILPAALALAMAPGLASAALATWNVNYADSLTAGGGFGGAVLNNTTSTLIDEYKFTAESVVNFHDNGDGVISGGDTFDDYIVITLDSFKLGGNTAFDLDQAVQNIELTAKVTASGTQLDAINYRVDSAFIEFFFDMPASSTNLLTTGDGTLADFGDLSTFSDGLLVQTGVGAGGGTNSPLIPDGAINIGFELTDVLSALGEFANFELFNPFIGLDEILFSTDSNNDLCGVGGTVCTSTVADFESEFGFNTTNLFFQTRSDGSAVKVIPEPAGLALLGIGLLGLGAARKRKA